MSASVIAEAFQVDRRTVYSWARRGYVTKYPGCLFDGLEVATWIREGRKESKVRTRRKAA